MGRAPDDLFDFMRGHSHAKEALTRILRWAGRIKERLTPFIALSIALHITVFVLLAISQSSTRDPQTAAAGRDDNSRVMRLAMESLRLDAKEDAILSEALASLTEEDFKEIMERTPVLDPRLDQRERTGIFRSLMKESLDHLGDREGGRSALDTPSWDLLPGSGGSGAIKLPEGDRLFRLAGDTEGESRLYRLRAKTAQRLESLRAVGEKEKERREVRNGQVELRTERGFLRVLEEYYFRECPYEQMLVLGGSLFYAAGGFPRLDPPEPSNPATMTGAGAAAPTTRTETGRADEALAVVIITGSKPREKEASGIAPVPYPALSEENIPEILDRLMELVDEDQVRTFKGRYLDTYDPDDPVLARLTQEFLYGNLSNVFILGDELSTAFDFLEELYYNKRFQDSLIAYGLKNRRSRTGAEVLFCLASLYDFERRGLAYLADSLDQIEAVLADRSGNLEVFNKQAKAFVLKEVYRDFVYGIRSRGLEDLDSVLGEYREEQEKIYRLLMATGGEAKNRALYALGGMYWDEGREDRALKTWKTIDGAYVHPPLDQIRWILSLTYGTDLVWSRINSLFQEESRKNSAGTLDRLKKFHIWEKRSAKLRFNNVNEQ
ncbi:MAG: hypothetical protein NT147_02060 [Candidatus Aminicenantes bacterium]|nr:hypothetical protein [Candidatus Aminicenantes bacterium]